MDSRDPVEAKDGLKVDEGEVLVYRLFDVADAVDLARAEALAAAPKARFKIDRTLSASAIEFPRPPLHLALGSRDLDLPAGRKSAIASAHVFDYGVVSIRYTIPVEPGTSLEALVPMAEWLLAGTSTSIDVMARRDADEVGKALGPALEHPHRWEGHETYQVFLVRSFQGKVVRAREVLTRGGSRPSCSARPPAPPSPPRSGKTCCRITSATWRPTWRWSTGTAPSCSSPPASTTSRTCWSSPPRTCWSCATTTTCSIANFTGCTMSWRGAGTSISHVVTRKYRKLQRRIAGAAARVSEMIERLENAVKIVGDFYLARLYQGAVRRFRLPAWQETVLRKQRLLSEVNDLIGHRADTSRAELLEVTIIVLILYEVVAALR